MDFNFDEFLKAVKSWPSTPSFAVLLILEVIVLKFIWPSSKEDFFLYGLASIIIATSLIWGIVGEFQRKEKILLVLWFQFFVMIL